MKKYLPIKYTNDEKRVAELLHIGCPHNHTDYCGWFFGEDYRQYEFARAREVLERLRNLGQTIADLEILIFAIYPKQYNNPQNNFYSQKSKNSVGDKRD